MKVSIHKAIIHILRHGVVFVFYHICVNYIVPEWPFLRGDALTGVKVCDLHLPIRDTGRQRPCGGKMKVDEA